MDNCFAFAGTLKIYSHTPCGDEKLYRASLYLTRNFPKRDFDFVDLIQVSDLVFYLCSIHKGLTSFQVKAFTRQRRSVRLLAPIPL